MAVILILLMGVFVSPVEIEVSPPPKSPAALVAEFLKEIGPLVASSPEVAVQLKKMSETTKSVLEFAAELGKLIGTNLDIVNETKSEEYLAIKELGTQLNERIATMLAEVEFSLWFAVVDLKIYDFEMSVDAPLEKVEDLFVYMLNPAETKTDRMVQNFVKRCDALEDVAYYIKHRIIGKCRLSRGAYSKFDKLHLHLMHRFNLTSEEIGEEKETILEFYYHIGGMDIQEAVSLFKKYESESECDTYKDCIQKLLTELRNAEKITQCLTEHVIEANQYDFYNVTNFLVTMQYDMARVLINTVTCAYLMDKEGIPAITRNINDEIGNASLFLSQYVPQKMNSTPLTFEDEYVQRMVREYKNSTWIIGPESYQEFATYIEEILRPVGRISLKRQVVVLPSPDDAGYNSHSIICPSYYCSFLKTTRGIDIMITRVEEIRVRESPRLTSPTTKIDGIKKIISSNYWHSTDEILNLVKKSYNLTDRWTKAVLLHRSLASFAYSCNFQNGMVAYTIGKSLYQDIVNIQFDNSNDRKFADHNACFQLYLSL